MKKLLVLTVMMMMLLTTAAFGLSVVGSKHDLRITGGGTPTAGISEVCVVCHTPHQASTSAGQTPLWNKGLSGQATYSVYSSPTLNAVPTELGGATLGTAQVSNLCLSCHDGTVSVLSMANLPNSGGTNTATTVAGHILASGQIDPASTANIGTSLTNDHPINFTYDATLATADGGLTTPSSLAYVDAGKKVPLFAGTVQCASCHDVHDNVNPPFLVMANTASALCTTCHVK